MCHSERFAMHRCGSWRRMVLLYACCSLFPMMLCCVGARCDIGIIILYPLRLMQDGQTPLHEAALYGHVEVVRLLLNADPPADVEASTTVGTRTHHPIMCFARNNDRVVAHHNPYVCPLKNDTALFIRFWGASCMIRRITVALEQASACCLRRIRVPMSTRR